jgi:hypothetical protein
MTMTRFGRLTPRLASALAAATIAAGVIGLGSPARANLIINPTFDSTITSDPQGSNIIATINQAIQFYQTNITTPITVNITFQEMSSGLGQSSTFFSTITYSQYLAALQAHAQSANDATALATLPAGPNNPVNGDPNVDVTTANLRALGINVAPATDSTIGLNTSITNFTGKTFNPSFYGLLGVVEHEMDEALGLGSNLDSGSTAGSVRGEDLFRYSGAGVRSYTTSSAATSFFSINGGTTNLAGFNQQGPPGGSDYGDWDSSALRVQNAFGTPGGSPSLTLGSPEVTALDVIGYNFGAAAVPEPSSILLTGMGLAGVVAYQRRRALRARREASA